MNGAGMLLFFSIIGMGATALCISWVAVTVAVAIADRDTEKPTDKEKRDHSYL